MATRSMTIVTADEQGNTYSNKYNYVNPNASDTNLYNAALKITSLSDNDFVSATITDSYMLTAPDSTTARTQATPLITRR